MKNQIMPLSAKFSALGIVLAALLLPTRALPAPATGELQNLKVIGHYFTTGLSGPTRYVSVKDTAKARYLVLVVSADLPTAGSRLYNTDFTLRYFHRDGAEDRANCDAMAKSEKPGLDRPYRFRSFAIGQAAGLKADTGPLVLGLGFFIEPDVESVDLYRLGIAEPTTYRIGTDRTYSVALITNSDAAALKRAQDVIQKGGYNVIETSDDLTAEQRGITIHYRELAESQAREISQRLTTEFGATTTVKKLELISGEDIVVWLGK